MSKYILIEPTQTLAGNCANRTIQC